MPIDTDSSPDIMDPIAIIGFALKFPGDATSPESFWRMISDQKCASTPFPKDRINIDAFYHPDNTRSDSVPVRNAHFLASPPISENGGGNPEDYGSFDAPFFSLTPSEALSMDPQHRGLLETAYHALESAGLPLHTIAGSKTGVFTGTFTDDYRISTFKDVADMPKHSATGVGQNFSANRLSWAFDFKGPSLQIDTACSSSLIAVDLACASLRAGDSSMALVGGSNIISSIEMTMALSSMGFLSPDGRCYSFDSRGNGYARGEGFGVLILKRLSEALENGDVIRAVIRSTGSNQNGRNRSITQTSQEEQVNLMRDTYAKAGLSLGVTRFVEAHGTGTAVGDPNEADAIGEVFGKFRSEEQPLYIGAVKSNIGHLEGASGMAGVIKALLALERGVIPPNTNFSTLNPKINAKALHLAFPTTSIPWPTDVRIRRASINSFGFGGSNAHVVLDDAFSYLRDRRLRGNCVTVPIPEAAVLTNGYLNGHANGDAYGDAGDTTNCNLQVQNLSNGNLEPVGTSNGGSESNSSTAQPPQLLLFSAFNSDAIKRLSSAYTSFFSTTSSTSISLSSLAYTLARRRSTFPSRSYALLSTASELPALDSLLSKPTRATSDLGLAFIFTGQGAQYAGMGASLLQYPSFRDSIARFGEIMKSLGCTWSPLEELAAPKEISNINKPEYSQPLCTALQLSLIQLFKSWGIQPRAVVGHSSGEIAAAYAAGALSFESAVRVAYFRGNLTASLSGRKTSRGGMLAVGLSDTELEPYFNRVESGDLVAACINSPKSVTVSGDADAIAALNIMLDEDGVFNRRLKVDVAYHSSHMAGIAEEYTNCLVGIGPGEKAEKVIMISSVTGETIPNVELCKPEYWVRNLVSPVRFSDAISRISVSPNKSFGMSPIYHMLELGPHSTLQGPIRDTLADNPHGKEISYIAPIKRTSDPLETVPSAAGTLWCYGYPIDIDAVNSSSSPFDSAPKLLTDLPSYPFDHSTSYIHRPRLQKDFLLRQFPRLDLLGAPVIGFNPLEPTWRKFLRISDTPWVEDHRVNGTILYPAAGMLVMAIEAANLMASKDREVKGFLVKEAAFSNSLAIPEDERGIETQLHLRPKMGDADKAANTFEFSLCSYVDDRWVRNCHGTITIDFVEREKDMVHPESYSAFIDARNYEDECTKSLEKGRVYSHFRKSGFQYGPAFQGMKSIQYAKREGRARAEVELFPWGEQEEANHAQTHIIHPTTLDTLAQLALLGLTNGTTEVPPVNLPTGTRNLWVSAKGLSHPHSRAVKAYAKTKFRGDRHNDFTITATDVETGDVLLSWASLETTNIGQAEEGTAPAKKQQTYFFELKPDISFLDQESASRYCSVGEQESDSGFRKDLELYMMMKFKRVVDGLQGFATTNLQLHHRKYFAWMQDRLSNFASAASPTEIEQLDNNQILQTLHSRIRATGHEGEFYAEVGANVLNVLRGDVDPLAILFEGGLAKGLYQDFNSRISGSLTRIVDLLAHKNPSMKMVEIGAGTGGTTAVVLNSLSKGTTARFERYDYTDISAAFFESAKEMFSTTAAKMEFNVLNAEDDPNKQGFETGTYDVVIAANVLHATHSLDVTLRNVHALLKPGGKLVLIEITSNFQQAGFGMGLLPGWWLSTEEFREGGPCIPESRWDSVLRRSGFSGLDIALKDFPDSESHEQSILVSTAMQLTNGIEKPEEKNVVLVEENSETQRAVANSISDLMEACTVVAIESMTTAQLENATCISLLEMEGPKLANMNEDFFTHTKRNLRAAASMLWVSMSSQTEDDQAKLRMVDGLRRVLTSENDDFKFVTLSLQGDIDMKRLTSRIVKVHQDTFTVHGQTLAEEEYTESDGALCIKRMVEAGPVNEHIENKTAPLQAEMLAFGQAPSLRLDFESAGVLDSMHFVENPRTSKLEEYEVEIQVKATGVIFRDCLIALGRMKDSMKTIGVDFSGVVTRVGPGCQFSTGDAVYGLCTTGCFSTFAVTHSSLVAKIPEGMSFSEAAGLPTAAITAHHSLARVAYLEPGESVLIHSAAGGTGQAALQIAQHLGAEIYVTVGTEEKKFLVMKKYNIPENRIFSSRSTAFAAHLMRLTRGRGVDVIFNSLSDEKLTASWECIAPFGRFIEIGKKDIFANSKLPMLPFAKNVSYSVVDIFSMAQERPGMIAAILKQVNELIGMGRVQVPQPVHVYGVSRMEDAFRYVQSGQNTGKTIVEMRENELVKAIVRPPFTWNFDPNASYLLAGGFGGVARSTARWMASRGARNLIILSRSGVRAGESAELVKHLVEQGVRIEAPKCDVSDEVSLKEALRQCEDTKMPAIKGCIQGSMVLRDALFDNMKLEDWNAAIRPRVQGTWNLHRLLPHGLDFFIMLSSVAGIIGSAGQSNYAASNSYLDEFARYRIAQGEKAVSLDLGWIESAGTIAENEALARQWIAAGCWIPISQPELFTLLDYHCNPSCHSTMDEAQLLIGMGPPAMVRAKGIAEMPAFLNRPMFRHLHQMQLGSPESTTASSDPSEVDYASLLRATKSMEEAVGHVVEALVRRVAKAMAMPPEEIDTQQPLYTYGVDSLLAIELRTWFKKTFAVDIAVFEMIAAKDFVAVAEKVVKARCEI